MGSCLADVSFVNRESGVHPVSFIKTDALGICKITGHFFMPSGYILHNCSISRIFSVKYPDRTVAFQNHKRPSYRITNI